MHSKTIPGKLGIWVETELEAATCTRGLNRKRRGEEVELWNVSSSVESAVFEMSLTKKCCCIRREAGTRDIQYQQERMS